MDQLITGVHHVTAVASNAQKNIDFYTGILGQRLVKKQSTSRDRILSIFTTVMNKGNPGSILTFFPYQGLVNGRHGKGMLNTTSFSVAIVSLDFWLEGFQAFRYQL